MQLCMCDGLFLTLMPTWKPGSTAVLNAKSIRNLWVRHLFILGIGLILPSPDDMLHLAYNFLVLMDAHSKWLEIMES